MTTKVNFRDATCCSISITSSWKSSGSEGKKDADCQTPAHFFQFVEMETQTGICTEVIQDQVSTKNAGMPLLDYLSTFHNSQSSLQWKQHIKSGFVSVDCEVATETSTRLIKDQYIEFVDMKSDAEVRSRPYACKT